jgi:UDP-N-acetylmuramoyl-tripeptide--D-alanyl-D-alanine ligase
MSLAIDDFASHRFSNPVLILGDMFELGEASVDEHYKIIEKLKETVIQQVFLIGKDFCSAGKDNLYRKFSTTAEAMQYLQSHPIKNAHILIKGSRGMHLETIIQYL